ncbi:RagB/SusD family nutrient uptake outer membrane protein [Puteibacter caeruleilacunae]|nr:RagB/SusD family nutrient uptake outer membrane protein [Puteibacter caeruleilacunae]
MKTSNRFILYIILVVGFLGSCSDYLDEDSRSELTTESFFNTDNEAMLAVNGLYRLLHTKALYKDVGLDKFYLHGADEVAANRNEDGIVHNYTWNETAPFIYDTYKDLYTVARNCALFIDAIDGNEKLSVSVRDQALGEALFIRALTYYHLTNIWGDVPYFRSLPTTDELATITRTDKQVIRDEMKVDLAKAFELLPTVYNGANLGRATKWAAATLKAKFHMMDEEWQQMRDECLKVINGGDHSLLNDYAAVFDQSDPTDQYNAEIVFAVDFTGRDAVISDMKSTRVNHYTPRIIKDEPADKSQLNAFKAALAERNENMRGYGKAVPLPEIADQSNWEDGDLRYDVAITQEYLGFALKFPYYQKMWNLDQIYSPRSNSPNNYVVFRLADVYLMAAEAENELDGPANAYQYVNEVRKRAFDPEKPWSGMTQGEFRLKLRDERKFELCGEGGRRMDLVRWGILVETVKTTVHRSFNNPQDNIEEKHNLYPIPEEEILLNSHLLDTDPTNNGWR